MLIDVSDVKTIPIEIEEIIINSFRTLSFDVENKIKNTEIQYLNDVMCAIEDIYAPFGNVRFYDEMVSVFEKYDFVCFHSTRMLSRKNVLEKGLLVNNWESYKDILKDVYERKGYGKEKIQKTLDIVNREYKRKYLGDREDSQLYFYSNLSMLEGETASYDQFCENIGGELARWALKKQYSDLYQPLKELGESFIVKFRLPFSRIASYQKDSIIYKFVLHYAGVYFGNKEFDIEFDGNTQCNIPSEDILGIIKYDKKIDY